MKAKPDANPYKKIPDISQEKRFKAEKRRRLFLATGSCGTVTLF